MKSKAGAMAQIQDIPKLVKEFVELSREYLLQETLEPAKKLGHFAGYSIGAAALWATALVLLSVAGLRALIDVLDPGPYWEALGYLIFSLLLVGFVALLVKVMPDRGVYDSPMEFEEPGDQT
jgi:hypothetical protein